MKKLELLPAVDVKDGRLGRLKKLLKIVIEQSLSSLGYNYGEVYIEFDKESIQEQTNSVDRFKSIITKLISDKPTHQGSYTMPYTDNDDMVDLLERNIDQISENHHGPFSIKSSAHVGLDTILGLVSNLQPRETLIQNYYLDIDIGRISKSFIEKGILNFIIIDPLYLHSILSKHYACIGDDDDQNTIFPNLTESEKLKRMNIKSLNDKLRNDNYVSLD
jgi:hypothetical protein